MPSWIAPILRVMTQSITRYAFVEVYRREKKHFAITCVQARELQTKYVLFLLLLIACLNTNKISVLLIVFFMYVPIRIRSRRVLRPPNTCSIGKSCQHRRSRLLMIDSPAESRSNPTTNRSWKGEEKRIGIIDKPRDGRYGHDECECYLTHVNHPAAWS